MRDTYSRAESFASYPEQVQEAALGAARQIIDAIEALPKHISSALLWDMLCDDDSSTLSLLADGMREPHQREVWIANMLLTEMLVGDVEGLAESLSHSDEPWATIRAAFASVAVAWRSVHPTLRTARDRQLERERR